MSNGPDRLGGPLLWTGTEVLVRPSACCGEIASANVSAYNPDTKTWRDLPPTPLAARNGAAWVWTGSDVIVTGGLVDAHRSDVYLTATTDGAIWNASTNTWRSIAPLPEVLAGSTPTAMWTGSEMLVWSSKADRSGVYGTQATGQETVLAYNPTSDSWRKLPPSGLSFRDDALTASTGSELLIWGGSRWSTSDTTEPLSDGAAFNPSTNRWRPIADMPGPPRSGEAAVWTGREVLIWGGGSASGNIGQGIAYDPTSDKWRSLPASPLRARYLATGVWTGRFFLILGGEGSGGARPTEPPGPASAAYDPEKNEWTAMPTVGLQVSSAYGDKLEAGRVFGASAVWTGREVVLLGGYDGYSQGTRPDGLVWTPASP